ncbi:kinase-like domain-containing protein [Aspergillus avenaceus]|uniref:non-specific serine/threonine protein kinase n=1 Tax=Aspergillus avenaceus TaxID=36643 RepID=A0A5N6TLW2_ASPAV|nr:kinase-like domain-containing protein [Aspergillus avenaceus]
MSGSTSDTSAGQRAKRDKIRVRLKRRSSRLLYLLGFRSSPSSSNTTSGRSSQLETQCRPSESSQTEQTTEPASGDTTSSAIETAHAHPHRSSVLIEPAGIISAQSTENQHDLDDQTDIKELDHEHKIPKVDRGKSRSTPSAITDLVSRKLSTSFGKPTVIRRSHLRSRPSVRVVQFNTSPSSNLSKQGDSANDSSDPSSSPASSSSPFRAKSTPPTSIEPSLHLNEVKCDDPDSTADSTVSSGIIPALSKQDTSRNLTPIEESPGHPLPTIRTVEAVANAKVFFETHFASIYSNVNPRTQRQQELEQYIRSLPLSLEEKRAVWKNWVTQEQEYLRQCRVLKSRFHCARHDEAVSLAGYEALKILGRGSFGVVRLVKERAATTSQGLSARDTSADARGRDGEGGRRRIMTGEKKDVFAMKVIRKTSMIRNSQEGHLRAERDFLVASAKSSWIVPLIASFQDSDHLYLIMDYMVGGDFLGLLMRRCILPEDIAKWYVAEMILCIEEAHRLCWIHRDVKPDNFLISASGHLKISDFGLAFDGHWSHDQSYYNDHRYSLAKRLGIQVDGDAEDQKEEAAKKLEQLARDQDETDMDTMPPSNNLLEWRNENQMRRLARSVVGTSQYMAPEVIRGHPYDGRCDWWSVGIILYECLYGFTPFASRDRDRTKLKIHHHHQTLHFPANRPSDRPVSAEAMDLINHLLQEREYRLSCNSYRLNDVLNARSAARNLFSSLDPSSQSYRSFYVYPNDAVDIKAHPFFCGVLWDKLHVSMPPFIPKVKGWEDTRYFEEADCMAEDDGSIATNAGEIDGVQQEQKQDMEQKEALHPDHQESCRASTHDNISSGKMELQAKHPRKRKHKKRPRDKILRDKQFQKTALGMRKTGAFIGYTYRRPKAVAMAFTPERGRLYLSRGHLPELYGW